MHDGDSQIGDSAPASPPVDHAIDRDLYCLECGYNLRGLSGDPVRCPECGFHNPIGDVEVPAPLIRRQLRRMETAPAMALLSLVILIPSLILFGVSCYHGGLEHATCLMLTVLVSLSLFVLFTQQFEFACGEQRGWILAFARYQVVGLVVLAGAIAACAGVTWIVVAWLYPVATDSACYVLPVALVATIALACWGVPPVHRWLRAPMDKLQRDVAVKIAREESRLRMTHQRRWRKYT